MADLCKLIQVVLTKNSLVFNKMNYLQIHGTAMGTRMVPSYSNLFIAKLKREYLQTQYKITRVWWRYIDDIFTIRGHGKPSLLLFIDILNRHHSTIIFTPSWSAEDVTFLNMRVFLKDGQVSTDLHLKPTDTH